MGGWFPGVSVCSRACSASKKALASGDFVCGTRFPYMTDLATEWVCRRIA